MIRRAAAMIGIALVAAPAAALPRMTARTAFAPLHADDPACVLVTIENDGEQRSVVLQGRRSGTLDEKIEKTMTELALELAPGARKLVSLQLAPDAQPRGVLQLVQDGEPLAVAAVDFSWTLPDRPLLAVTTPAPPMLAAASRRSLGAALIEVGPGIPPNPFAWPRLGAFAWDAPRSADIPPAMAAALRHHVEAGGRLVFGLSAEEPDALERAGLGDLLPSSGATSDGVATRLGSMRAGATAVGVEDALVISRGLGEVVLVPGSLDEVAEASWQALADIEPPPAVPTGQAARPAWAQRRSWVPGQEQALELLIPDPPWRGAIVVLVTFLLAAVPLDGWLIRRSLRRGRRGRAGALRYPAIVLASTAAALAVAGHASGGDLRTWRVDVVDLGADGRGTGESVLLAARGRSGRVSFDAGEAAVVLVRGAGGMYGERSIEAQLTARADTTLPLSSGSATTAPWEPLWVRTAWIPRDIPAIVPPALRCEEPQVPEADGMALRECGARAMRLRHDHADGLAMFLGMEHDDADVVLVWKRRLGPDLTVDGRSTDEGPTYTIVRYRFPPDVRPSPPAEVAP